MAHPSAIDHFSEDIRAVEEMSFLGYAAHGRVSELIEALGRQPALMKCKDEKEKNALHLASQYGHLSVVEALLTRGADWRNKDEDGKTPLHWACLEGRLSVAETLLAIGAEGNNQSVFGWTPLHLASVRGHELIVKALLANGADGNIQNEDGWTSLHWATSTGRLSIVEALLAGGADGDIINKSGNTALDYAKVQHSYNHQEIVTVIQRHMTYQSRRQFMMFLSDYQFLEPPARFPRESVVEKVLVIEDLHRYLMTFL